METEGSSRSNGENNPIVLEDCIKASLATMELVKHTRKDCFDNLSPHEVESVHVSLNRLIRTAESMKEKLPSRKSSVDTIKKNDENTTAIESTKHERQSLNDMESMPPPIPSMHKANSNANVGRLQKTSTEHQTNNKKASSKAEGEVGAPQRRLSTPCLVPLDPAGLVVSHNMLTFLISSRILGYK